jgi:single-stranded-DNA-specific exonuclease
MIAARWAVPPPPDPRRVAALAAALRLPDPLAALLVQRGFGDPARARAFLRPGLEGLGDPGGWADMAGAVALVARAVRAGTPILVHGDYDVDGQCAAALLTRVLRAAGGNAHAFVPHRLRDGYDFGPAGLAAAARLGAGLVITCDCGITAVETVAAARAAGIEVLVTDHHLPGDVLPPATAVLDPRRPDCPSTDKDLSGTGVAFKLAQALAPALGLSPHLPLHFLDFVAFATVADVVPLTGENRILVRHGLKLLADSRWAGLRALVETAGLAGRPLRAGHVGFILAPRLNAAGRIGDAGLGLRLLLTDDPAEAAALARELETLNARRQALDQRILDEAVAAAERELARAPGGGTDERALVLAAEGWHPGVIGIVASRLVERYARPTLLIAWEGDVGRGSGRSVPGFDLHAALQRVGHLLEKYGGHTMAAGLTLRRERYDAFRVAFCAVARELLGPDDLVPAQRVDLELPLGSVSPELEQLMRHLEPCGPGNPAPVFGVRGARAVDARRVGTNHLRFTLDDRSGVLPAIAFEWADAVPHDWLTRPLDVAFRLERDEWSGRPGAAGGAGGAGGAGPATPMPLQARVVALAPSGGPEHPEA